ncbi:MAG: hypothetical protein WCY60_03655 [Trueperaceae bacterium]
MWLPRHVEAIEASPEPTLLWGGEEYGAPFLVDALRNRGRVAWFEFGPRTLHDPVAQGNELARAVNATLPTPLLGRALPLGTHLAALRHYRSELLPLRLAVTTFGAPEELLGELLDLRHHGYKVLVDLRHDQPPPLSLAERTRVLGPPELRLAQNEASDILPRALSQDDALRLWQQTNGRFLSLLSEAHAALGLGPVVVPSALGERVPEQDAALVEPALAVRALRQQGELIDALEVAVMGAPELVNDLIRQAGPRYQEEGLLRRLHLLLTSLPEEYAQSERVLEWRLVAGFAAGDLGQVLPEVDAYLAVHKAPALRARRAGAMRRELGFAMARQALDAQRSPLTLWQYGRLHPDAAAGIDLLRQSVRAAEETSSRYDVVRNAGALVARLSQEGEYTEAASWARWTLDMFDRGEFSEGNRRLTVVNDLGVARIMTGDLVGLRRVLEDAQVMVEGSLPTQAALLRSTLAWLELAEQRPRAALELIGSTYQASGRGWRARQGYQLVRCLLELGQTAEAERVAGDVSRLAAADTPYEQALAALARGMVGAVLGAPGAADDLQLVLHTPELVAEQRLMAALYFLLATDGGAPRLPARTAAQLGQLHPTALRVLSGPESLFAPLWSTLGGHGAGLTLRFLGPDVSVVHEGTESKLPQRVAEVALALALNPDGIGRDALNDFLTPDGQAPFTAGGVRGMLTRVRRHLPVSEVPYRLTVAAAADVLELRGYLAQRRVREAVSLYRQPLLPLSDAPGVVEERERLEEELRQAVLMSRDPDALCELAERLGDDLQLWSAAADVLGAGDPRLAVARARVLHLEQAYAQRDRG